MMLILARLKWFQILVDGKPQNDWGEMAIVIGIESPVEGNRPGPIYRDNSYDKHFWIRSGPISRFPVI
jgi:hypothetical protein